VGLRSLDAGIAGEAAAPHEYAVRPDVLASPERMLPSAGAHRNQRMMGVRVSVIIPTLNEAACLPDVLHSLPRDVAETIIVDGLSSDGTIDVALACRPDAKVVLQTVRGKGAALRAGLEAATGEIVVMMDADGSTNPDEIPRFVEALMNGADFAKGSRFLPGGGTNDMPRLRRFGNGMLVGLTNLLFGTRYTDITYGYNAIWRDLSAALALEIDGWAMEIVGNIRAARHRLRVVEVPSFEEPRVAGEAKLQTFSAGWSILKAILRERIVPVRKNASSRALVAVRVHGVGLADPWLAGLAKSHTSERLGRATSDSENARE
jgi:glycosyltransferase involved in cell wall biosynthesis